MSYWYWYAVELLTAFQSRVTPPLVVLPVDGETRVGVVHAKILKEIMQNTARDNVDIVDFIK